MQIWIHDNKMKKIVALNNDIPDMMSYTNSSWHSYLDQATSTFDFTIPKFSNGELHEDLKLINDECFVSFYVNGSYQVFYIATLQEDDFNIQLTCNNTNLEYALEYANPFSGESAQTIEWYLNHMDLLSFAAVEIGNNEIPDRKRTLTFDSQETKMNRLQSLMSKFEAEFEFKVELNRDGTYKRIVINIYQEADDTHHGIGTDRKDVVLYYSNGLKGVQVSSDKTQMFNAGVFTGKDGLNLADVEISEKNADGIEEFYSRKGNPCLYAPIAMNRYPATMRAEGQDNWIRKDFTTEYENVNDLKAYALRTLKQYAYPLVTYTASVQSGFVSHYTDLKLGDTIRIIDKNFVGGLALEARVSEMIISFDNPANNSFVFTNYRKLDNKPTSALQTRIDQAVESKLPYRIELATTGGVTFKNNEGETIVKPSLYKGNLPCTTDVSWRWALDGNVTVAMQYLARAENIDSTAVLTVSAYIGNNEVATTEITLTNVNDGADGAQGEQGPQGPQGPKGDRGEDGIAGKDGVGLKSTVVTYGLSTSETTQPTSWTAQVPTLTKGKYLWTKTVWTYTDNTTETGYQKTYIAKDGNNGEDGIPGKDGVGIRATTITYAGSTSGATPPINGWTSSIPSVPAGSYLWTKTVWTYTDNTSETGYSVSKMGEKGEDGKNSYMHTAYANITKLCNENENFTITTSSIVRYGYADKWVYKTFEAGTYAATNATFGKDPYSGKVKQCDLVTDFSLTDSTGRGWLGTYSDNNANAVSDPSRYTWQLTKGPQGIQGIQGPQGIPGEPGADGRTQYTHIAYADNATGGGFSQTDQNKAYIGMYVDFTAADSNDPTKYRWTKWKGSDGAQGIPGKPGADGKTPYIHFAYADDDKGTNFSLTDKNQQFQGYYSDYTEADSTDYRKYKWVDRLANIKGGSRNYFKDSLTKNFQTTDADTFDWRTYIVDAFWKNKDRLKKNFVKMSFDITFPVALENDYTANIYFSAAPWYSNRVTFKADTTSRQHFEFEIDLSSASDDYRTDNVFIRFGTKYGFPSGFKIILENMMLSIGSYYPDYIQAIEDTQDQLDNKADQTLTQDQLNALAEKNALIQAEMEAKASMDTVNQWITAYQNYVNANEADKKKSEQALQDASNRLLQVKYDVNDLKQQWNFIDTYMSVQNEGLIIGKKDGSAYAKFSDDRISLFSGNSEVMYISQGTLNIANGIFTKTIQIGRFRFETHPNDADMLIIRFLGG